MQAVSQLCRVFSDVFFWFVFGSCGWMCMLLRNQHMRARAHVVHLQGRHMPVRVNMHALAVTCSSRTKTRSS